MSLLLRFCDWYLHEMNFVNVDNGYLKNPVPLVDDFLGFAEYMVIPH